MSTSWTVPLLALGVIVSTVWLSAEPPRKPAIPVPWGIAVRPMPQGTNVQALLPRRVGDFVRDELPAGATLKSDEDLLATYRNGRETIEMGLSRPDSAADAHDAIDVTRDEARRNGISLRGERRSVGTEPSFFTVADFASWSRDRYFFYAKASSLDVLDRFMKAFPY